MHIITKGLEWHFSWCSCYLYLCLYYRCGQWMDKIGWIDLRQSISHLGSPNVGRQPSMNESARVITTVNGLGIFVMNEGHLLFLLMIFAVMITLALNMVVQGFIG